jgi:hypothetical protein
MALKNHKVTGTISFFNEKQVFLRKHDYKSYNERTGLISNFLRVAPMGSYYVISPNEVDVNSYSKTVLNEKHSDHS